MFRYVFVVCALSVVLALPAQQGSSNVDQDQEELERFQNENAHYSFNSAVDDDINDNAQERSETRDGTKVTGKYSYSDGYVRRTVHYIADENGYRIEKEETQPIGDGPVFNPNGQADISGSDVGSYSIKLNHDDDDKHYKEIKSQ